MLSARGCGAPNYCNIFVLKKVSKRVSKNSVQMLFIFCEENFLLFKKIIIIVSNPFGFILKYVNTICVYVNILKPETRRSVFFEDITSMDSRI